MEDAILDVLGADTAPGMASRNVRLALVRAIRQHIASSEKPRTLLGLRMSYSMLASISTAVLTGLGSLLARAVYLRS